MPKCGSTSLEGALEPYARVPWFSERVGALLDLRTLNVFRSRSAPELSAGMRARLEEFFAAEYDILDRRAPTGEWLPPPGYVPG